MNSVLESKQIKNLIQKTFKDFPLVHAAAINLVLQFVLVKNYCAQEMKRLLHVHGAALKDHMAMETEQSI
jgi:hypothetical protein